MLWNYRPDDDDVVANGQHADALREDSKPCVKPVAFLLALTRYLRCLEASPDYSSITLHRRLVNLDVHEMCTQTHTLCDSD